MGFLLREWSTKTIIRLMGLLLCASFISGCGGGGAGAGTTFGTSGDTAGNGLTGSISLALTNQAGASTSSVTLSSPLTVKATVTDKNGDLVSGALVNFSVGALSVLSPSSGSVLTNVSGVATITLSVKDLQTAQAQVGAADTINAGVTISGNAVTTAATYSIGSAAISLDLTTPSNGTATVAAYGTQSIGVRVLAGGALYTAQPVAISFNSPCAAAGKANLPASVSTVNGSAQVVYRDIGCGGADTVTVSTVGVDPVVAQLTVAAPVAASIGFVSASPSDKAIVIQGSGGNGRVQTARLTFQVRDTFGSVLANQLVNFAVNSTKAVTLQTLSGTTDVDGNITVSVSSGAEPTTFRVVATLASNVNVTAISDSVIVTTGQPVQAAFSVAPATNGIEGWNFNNVTDVVTILMADQNGNPVADGTPVLFTTDVGAIGTSSSGGCLSTNGACTVTFRSQNPRVGQRLGVATISVSSATEATTLTGTVRIYLNASTGTGTKAFISTAPNIELGQFGTATLPVALTCGAYSLRLILRDDNNNPLPVGTTITAANSTGLAVGTIIPATVPDIPPPAGTIDNTATYNQSSNHLIPITPDATACALAGTSTGTFDLTIKSPNGQPVLYSFSLAYP